MSNNPFYKEHPSFSRPNNLNSSIWRYMEFSKFEWLIKEKRLYMPCTNELGDRLEGTISQGEKKLLNRMVLKADIKYRSRIAENNYKIERMVQKFCNTYFVSCWHMNEEKFPTKWGDFLGYPNEGIVIRSTFQKLYNSVPDEVFTGMVNYLNYESDPFRRREETGEGYPNFFEYIISKDKNYEYEQEVRSIASLATIERIDPTNLFQDNKNNPVYAPNIKLEELIIGIHVHPTANEAHINSVHQLLKQEKLDHLLELEVEAS